MFKDDFKSGKSQATMYGWNSFLVLNYSYLYLLLQYHDDMMYY